MALSLSGWVGRLEHIDTASPNSGPGEQKVLDQCRYIVPVQHDVVKANRPDGVRFESLQDDGVAIRRGLTE